MLRSAAAQMVLSFLAQVEDAALEPAQAALAAMPAVLPSHIAATVSHITPWSLSSGSSGPWGDPREAGQGGPAGLAEAWHSLKRVCAAAGPGLPCGTSLLGTAPAAGGKLWARGSQDGGRDAGEEQGERPGGGAGGSSGPTSPTRSARLGSGMGLQGRHVALLWLHQVLLQALHVCQVRRQGVGARWRMWPAWKPLPPATAPGIALALPCPFLQPAAAWLQQCNCTCLSHTLTRLLVQTGVWLCAGCVCTQGNPLLLSPLNLRTSEASKLTPPAMGPQQGQAEPGWRE